MKINNLYNFKNPVKNFLNIDILNFPNNIPCPILNKLSWVEPLSFRVKKQDDKYRTLKMPNILNFFYAYEHFKDMPNFDSIQNMDFTHKRLSANIETGDFVSGEYDRQLEIDFERLCIYDNLLRMDIKEYYGRIYTHKIDFQGHDERFLSNMNLGATNGLIMGNYLSLYFAEVNLKNISYDLAKEIEDLGIGCEFTYFSDDFYFFCNKKDNEKIVKAFDKVLEKYELERNEIKKEIWTYESFNNYNIVERNWKKVIAHCNVRYHEGRDDNKLYFINQIIYRMSNFEDEKLKKVFINNFFKTKYFQELNPNKYKVKNYDYHQLSFIFKFSPEAMLYAVDKFSSMEDFEIERLHKFLKVRYKEALLEPFNEEQLYFYFAIERLSFRDILIENKDAVLKSDNQILISYYLKDKIFGQEDIIKLKACDGEKHWLQSYHLILYSDDLFADIDNSIERYLIPEKAKMKETKKEFYKSFYKENLQLKNPLIRDIPGVYDEIKEYLRLRIEESGAAFEAIEEDWDVDAE